MRYDKAHKQKTREKVLDVAARAIRGAGPDGVGVAAIMAEAGLTHGGFYAHFASKEALIADAIDHMFAQARARLVESSDGKHPARVLAAYIGFYLSRAHRDACESGCPIAALAADLPRLPADARRKFSRGVGHLTDFIAAQLRALGRSDAPALARSTVAELVGALSIARIETDKAQSDAILAASKHALIRRLELETQT
ncbi:MAG: TetR/AcrR family transcriptional regulator [Xanthomonadales bacterium]|nr:TetR/AcrR family transcriptional regulator [Xanthomonadales bacterium]